MYFQRFALISRRTETATNTCIFILRTCLYITKIHVVWFLLGNSPHLNCICRRFGKLCSIFIGGYPPMKMEQCSETSVHKIHTTWNYPEESIQHSEHGESLKSRIKIHISNVRPRSGISSEQYIKKSRNNSKTVLSLANIPMQTVYICWLFSFRNTKVWLHPRFVLVVQVVQRASSLTRKSVRQRSPAPNGKWR
jgi:hypothetical protein